MADINPGIIGPIIYAFIEAIKRVGLPGKYIQLFSVLISLIAGYVMVTEWTPLSVLTNAGVIYLSIEGAYKNAHRSLNGDSNER